MRKGEQHLIRMTRDAHMAYFLASDQASFINFAGDTQGRGGVSSRTGSYLRMSPKGGRMRYVPVCACVLHLVRCYLEGDRRSLIAAYEGEDLGTIFLSESTRNPGRPLAVGAFDAHHRTGTGKSGASSTDASSAASPALYHLETSRSEPG